MGTRLQAAERRIQLIEAARELFAEKGFNGTSIREIAKAAGVSEALLYKHFPDKKSIYTEILNYSGNISGIFKGPLDELKPGAESLVAYVYILVRLILFEVPGLEKAQYWHERLLFRSLIGDTTFAEGHFRNVMAEASGRFSACITQAVADGDMSPAPIDIENGFWFAHHLAMSLNLCHLSGESAFEHAGSKLDLMNQAVRFILRGLGMTEGTINRCLHPEALDRYFHRIYS